MTNIRRYYRHCQIYFLTHVTEGRKPILTNHIVLFQRSAKAVLDTARAEVIAWVVLPDHFHLIIDPRQNDLSNLMKRLKLKFSGLYRAQIGQTRGQVWQHRFWDHIVRDQDDLNNHIDYVHFNPVKHGFTDDPFTYEHSSLARYFQDGLYEREWGCHQMLEFEGEYGE